MFLRKSLYVRGGKKLLEQVIETAIMHTYNANLISKSKALHSFLTFLVQMQR